MDRLTLLLLWTALAGACIPIGALLARIEHIRSRWLEEELRHFAIAFGGGILVGAVALVLIPKGIERVPRQKSTSHRVYRTPWLGDPRVNVQNAKGMAKPYQVRQVIKAIEKLEGTR